MSADPLFVAAICAECRHVALLARGGDVRSCPLCSAGLFLLPGVRFVHRDLPLFAELERIVYDAQLSKSEATLIAAELESVSGRWEPPDLVLQHLSHRLQGLATLYDPQQDYSRLLLVVGMLLTIVGSRLIFSAPAPIGSRRPSGIRELAPKGSALPVPPARASVGRERPK